MRVIVIGTRGSLLAQAQTRWVMERLKENWPETEFKIKTITSKSGASEEAIARDLQKALATRQIDIGLYSLKHLPLEAAPGLQLVAVPRRSDPREAFLGRAVKRLNDLPEGAVVGANAARRKAQLLFQRPDLQVREVRGDLEERLAALAGEYDALIMGAAELLRLDLRNRIDQFIDPQTMLPAPGQGALGLEVRQGDDWAEELAYSLNHRPSFDRVLAERAFCRALGVDKGIPTAALAAVEDDGTLYLEGVLMLLDGSELIRGDIEGEAEEAEELGNELAQGLLEQGGRELVERGMAGRR
jgi:hydroxymethylbilane synthase